MLQNVCENCIRILEEEKHRQLSVCSLSCEKSERNWHPQPKREKLKIVRTIENIAAVAESVCEAPSTSIHRRSQQLNI